MHHIQGVPRQQIALLPPALEDFVAADHPVRVVDAFVAGLDLAQLGFGKAEPEATGRPPYHPGDLLKLYLYGYLNRLRSTRVLERECKRNVEVMWLLGRLAPDFKTIANFRKDNSEAIRGVCRALVMFCGRHGLVGGEVVGIDGSKFHAATSGAKAFTAGRLQRTIEQIDATIDKYLREVDQNDAIEQSEEQSATAEVLERLRNEREELQKLAAEMIAAGRTQTVAGEPEATIMGHAPSVVGYNVQTAVDVKHKLIIHHEVVDDANDRRQLYPMASAAKAMVSAERLVVLADSGYHNGEHARRCEDEQIEAVVPAQRTSNQHSSYFPKDAFVYDETSDTYRCPAGATMRPRENTSTADPRRRYATKACASCSLRPQCTSGKRRQISRAPDEDAAMRADHRARDRKLMKLRSAVVEHPFAWLKRTVNSRMLSRGLANAKAEIALAVTSYNIVRLLTVIGTPRFLTLLKA